MVSFMEPVSLNMQNSACQAVCAVAVRFCGPDGLECLMEKFRTSQIVLFVLALLVAGAVVSWGTKALLERYVLYDASDPLQKGGLSPTRRIGPR